MQRREAADTNQRHLRLGVTKLDVLDGMETLQIAVGYR